MQRPATLSAGALAFFDSVIGLHDSTIADFEITDELQTCVLILNDVCRHSEECGFTTAYDRLEIKMSGCSVRKPREVSQYFGYDVVDAELSPGSLWLNTVVGSLLFEFDSIGFRGI